MFKLPCFVRLNVMLGRYITFMSIFASQVPNQTHLHMLDSTYDMSYDLAMSKTTTLTTTQARADLYNLVKKACSNEEEFIIQGKSGQAAILMGLDEWESWKETAEIMMIPGAYESIMEGVRQMESGDFVPLSEIKIK